MRTIKFRGKKPSDGSWVYGSFVISEDLNAAIYYQVGRGSVKTMDYAYVDPDSVGQFTGLIDKNGKEIYEGDILAVEGIPFGVVRWHEDGYFFIYDSTGGVALNNTYRALGEMIRFFNRTEIAYFVIGNIHDNPELWKGGNP